MKKLLAHLMPGPLGGTFALLAALGAGIILWMELEPVPRQVVSVQVPKWKEEFRHRTTAVSPDGKTLVFGFDTDVRLGDRPPPKHAVHLLDLHTGEQMVLSDTTNPRLAFSPDGKRIAGVWEESIIVWDRSAGSEIKRYPVKAQDRKEGFDRQIVFLSDGELVVWNDWIADDDGKIARRMFALNANKPWQGTDKDFDAANAAQHTRPLTSATSADGKRTVAIARNNIIVNDFDSGAQFTFPHDINIFGGANLSPDGKWVLISGRHTGPTRRFAELLVWLYAEGKEPEPQIGAVLIEVETGRKVAFIACKEEYGVAPDGKTFVAVDSLFTPADIKVALYDVPFTMPWGTIVGGAAAVFVVLVLLNKAWRAWRSRKPADESEQPRKRPPWEEEASSNDPDDDRPRRIPPWECDKQNSPPGH